MLHFAFSHHKHLQTVSLCWWRKKGIKIISVLKAENWRTEKVSELQSKSATQDKTNRINFNSVLVIGPTTSSFWVSLSIQSFKNQSIIRTIHIKCTKLHAAPKGTENPVSKRKLRRKLSFQSVLQHNPWTLRGHQSKDLPEFCKVSKIYT